MSALQTIVEGTARVIESVHGQFFNDLRRCGISAADSISRLENLNLIVVGLVVRLLGGEKTKKFGSNFQMPVVYYSQLNSVAYGAICTRIRSTRPDRYSKETGGDSCQIK